MRIFPVGRILERNNHNGFTLLELIVVLVIVGLIFGLAVPNLFKSIASVELKTAARKTAAILRQSGRDAYFKKIPVKAAIDVDADTITILHWEEQEPSSDQGEKPEHTAAWVEKSRIRFVRPVDIAQCSLRDEVVVEGSFEILFSPLGHCTGGSIKLWDLKKREHTVKMDLFSSGAKIL